MAKKDQTRILKEARLQMGYSQQRVADILGMSIGQYQRLENGERLIGNASMKIGLRVCIVLGIDPYVLTFGEEQLEK